MGEPVWLEEEDVEAVARILVGEFIDNAATKMDPQLRADRVNENWRYWRRHAEAILRTLLSREWTPPQSDPPHQPG